MIFFAYDFVKYSSLSGADPCVLCSYNICVVTGGEVLTPKCFISSNIVLKGDLRLIHKSLQVQYKDLVFVCMVNLFKHQHCNLNSCYIYSFLQHCMIEVIMLIQHIFCPVSCHSQLSPQTDQTFKKKISSSHKIFHNSDKHTIENMVLQ